MEQHIGLITRGINNIYTVQEGDTSYLCRIKGKQLSQIEEEYNPLAVGDRVYFVPTNGEEGLVLSRLERKNSFQRWNAKGGTNQTVVANMDLIVCVTSSDTPPFRPRFIDRVIACSRNVEVLIVMNKCDILLTEDEYERFVLYKKLGYSILGVSAKTGENLDRLSALLAGKLVAFVGQSGVGKSTLINKLLHVEQRTGEVSEKYNRGRHTTNHALMLKGPNFTIVDTPGVREFLVPHTEKSELLHAFPEFTPYASQCAYEGCLHQDEPGCRVKQAVEEEAIHYDRYESYLRMLASLDEKKPQWMGKNERSNSWHARYERDESQEY
ncbi:MAG: ribosome small subunit-dependent GTPase A [Sphaerochaeta sp.]|jgi:ribosome biogenesis GTPase|uniref:ribosome small subunit-dependent GTPase A n=1 Tax=Sphaerochaeta sp. TaxID=1972642 RepID=UPI002FC78678